MESNEIPPSYPPPPPLGAPPPMAPPPLIAPTVQPRPPGKGRGWMILAFVLLGFLLLSMLTNFGQLTEKAGRGGSTIGPRLDEAILENNHSSDKIAVVDIDGIITSGAIDKEG